jgi:hypothetical protein
LTAQWDYVKGTGEEPVHYLMQLVLRTEIGSGFRAKFYIKSADTDAAGGSFSASVSSTMRCGGSLTPSLLTAPLALRQATSSLAALISWLLAPSDCGHAPPLAVGCYKRVVIR